MREKYHKKDGTKRFKMIKTHNTLPEKAGYYAFYQRQIF